ncbi:MAG TPA: DUF4097 family beta strand repeat-containing protein [Mobilitalea sp.]|nr:DUF4097 family beta strand repeat-containing protein [Mobilitalea sp.]
MVIIMKKVFGKFTGITLLLLTAGALLTGCGIHYTFGGGTTVLDRNDAKEFKVDKETVDSITSIVIHTGMAKVELIESDNYSVDINYLYWEEEPEYTLEDGKLYFDDSNAFPDSYSINFNLHNTIKIYLPKNAALQDLAITNSSGDVSVAGFVADDMEATVSYGDFTMKNAAAANADITLSSGTSKISDFQTGKLDFTNSYGDATFTNINTGDALLSSNVAYDRLKITMSSGDVKISGLNTASVKINNSYGNITCSDITAEDFNADLSSGDLDVSNADLKSTDISNSYGDTTLSLVGPDTDYSLDLRTSYGNVKVGNKEYEESAVIDNNGSRKVTADLSSGDVKVTFK